MQALTASRDLQVELKPERPPRLVLRGTYGDKIHQAFRMSRQGVRWRFWRLFNDIYVSSFETILFIEKTFGPVLREHAIRISQERNALRQQIPWASFEAAGASGGSDADSPVDGYNPARGPEGPTSGAPDE